MKKFAEIQTEWDDLAVQRQVEEAIASRSHTTKRSSMKIGPYNGFPGTVRVDGDFKIKIAIELGLIPRPEACSICGKSEGRLDYHSEDYGRPLRVAPICQSCHLALHNRNRGPGYLASWERRIRPFSDGTKWFEALS